MKINYNGRKFSVVQNSSEGDVDTKTVFHYHQQDMYLWGHYFGAKVEAGVILGKVLDDSILDFRYWHYDQEGNLKQGKCRSTPTILEDGRIRLTEEWQWTSGIQAKGSSIIEEII